MIHCSVVRFEEVFLRKLWLFIVFTTVSAIKAEMSSGPWYSVGAPVSRCNSASASWLSFPFLYLTWKLKSERRRRHLVSIPDGYVMLKRQCRAWWSVWTVNYSYRTCGCNVCRAQTTAWHSLSDAAYFLLAAFRVLDQYHIGFICPSSCVWNSVQPIP